MTTVSCTMNRRQFIAGTAAVGAAAGIVATTAGTEKMAHASYEEMRDGTVGIEENVDLSDAAYDVDYLIVGSGCAGVCSAVEACDQGLSVLMCEAGAFFGGTTTATEGMCALNSKYLDALGIHTDLDEAAADEYSFSNYLANKYIIDDFVHSLDENFVWMEEYCGVKFEQNPTCNTLNPYQHFYVNKGAGMIDTMVSLAQDKGATCLLNNCVKRLIMNDGRVAGAIVDDTDAGTEYKVKCKAVLLATGGFAQNPELIEAKLPWLNTDRCVNSALGRVEGDGYYMATAAGADTHGMVTCGWYDPCLKSFPFFSELSVAAECTPYLWINERGERWIKEDITLAFSEVCYALFSQRRAISILSQSAVDRIMSEGCPVGWAGYIKNGTVLSDLQNQLDDAKSQMPEGFYYGESFDEFAKNVGVDADTFKDTIARYASMVVSGEDSDYGKDPQYLWDAPVDGEPLYGFELCGNLLNISGGVQIDPDMNVITVDGTQIPGLYGAGADASGLLGFIYPNKYASTKQGWCMHSGRRAAQHAAEYIAKL
ncbi:FAD-binding protein [bacterium]|nr:FAD-binding protein [bacterium]